MVTTTREKRPPMIQLFHDLGEWMRGPFLELRGGPLIEAIVWRHNYLKIHPTEEAIILVDLDHQRVVSATTVYTKDGRLFGSSQMLGDNDRLRGLTAADIRQPDKIRRLIQGIRDHYLGMTSTQADQAATNSDISAERASVQTPQDVQSVMMGTPSAPAGANVMADPSDMANLLGSKIARAEATGDYSVVGISMPDGVQMNPFAGEPANVLQRSYEALHDPAQAGLVPVARGTVNLAVRRPDADHPNAEPVTEPTDTVVFDWDGIHYLYNPDFGTWGVSLPVNPLTGRPFLCLKNGDLFESISFCATYPKAHPGEQVGLIAPPGGPYGAVYTRNGLLHFFSPFLGRTVIPKHFQLKLSDTDTLTKMLALLVEREKKQLEAAHQTVNPNAVIDGLPGDDADLQMRRAYLALKEAGVSPQLVVQKNPTGEPLQPLRQSLTCQWRGTMYRHDFDGPLTTTNTVPQTK